MRESQLVSHDDLAVCAIERTEYKARDAIHAAFFRGQTEPIWQGFFRGLKAWNKAEQSESEPDENVVNAAAETFRYGHDLITAEETEQWLAARGLNLEDFTDYFARQYWAGATAEEPEPADVDFPSASSDVHEAFVVDLILSGQLDQWTTELMWRLAAEAADKQIADDAISTEQQIFFDRCKVKSDEVSHWLSQIGRDREWFEQMLRLEAAYRGQCEKLLNPQARKRELVLMRLPLTRFEAEVVEVESMDAAKEALFCIQEDGMSMQEVAAEARYPYRLVVFLRQEVPPDLEQKFLSVGVGEILGPFARGDGFELYRITQKQEPDGDDPEVQQQIDQRLRERYFSDLVSKHVESRLPSTASGQ